MVEWIRLVGRIGRTHTQCARAGIFSFFFSDGITEWECQRGRVEESFTDISRLWASSFIFFLVFFDVLDPASCRAVPCPVPPLTHFII